jgi:hypothetical protein
MKLSNIIKLGPLLFCASALLLSASVGHGDEKHQDQTSAHNVQPAPVHVIQDARAVEQNKPKQKWYERPTIADWGVLLVTLAYVGASIGILRATKQQAKAAVNQVTRLEETLAATKTAAQAAEKSADVAERSLMISQAAHLSLGNVTISDVSVATITYEIRNSGRLSATECTPTIFVSCKPNLDFPLYKGWRTTDIIGGRTIAPDETWQGSFPPTTELVAIFDGDNIPLTPIQVTEVSKNSLTLYVEIGVNYRNGFGKVRHIARGFVFNTATKTFRRLRDE